MAGLLGEKDRMSINQIVVLSQKEIECCKFIQPVAVISIGSPGSPNAKVPDNPLVYDTLFLKFLDLDPESLKRNGVEDWETLVPNCMTDMQANAVVSFVKEAASDGIEMLVINCEAGISRSRGVASMLCRWYGLDDRHLYESGTPNAWCKNKIREALYRRAANESL